MSHKYGSHPAIIARNDEIARLALGGMRRDGIMVALGVSIYIINQVLHVRGIRTGGQGVKNVERNAEIVRKYESGMVAEAIGQELGITRERVCQILRPLNVISTKHERDRLAKEAVASEIDDIKRKAKEKTDAKIATALDIVRGGMSQHEAARQTGLSHNIIERACKVAGVQTQFGRWLHRTGRMERVRQLAPNHNQTEVIRIIRAEGDPIGSSWIASYCADVQFAHRPKQPRESRKTKERVARVYAPNPDAFFTPERTVELRRYYFNGTSGQQIADIMGCSRNTVLGKVHRLRKAGQLLPVPQQIPMLVG